MAGFCRLFFGPRPNKFPWTSSRLCAFLRGMAQPEQKSVTPVTIAVDAVLLAIFAVIIYWLVAPHVPSTDARMIMLWGGLCTACMTGVFWLCIQMFRVVLRAQMAARKK